MTQRVRMIIYDDVETNLENPIVLSDEPYYGGDEIQIQAANLARNLRRHNETES